MHIPTYIYTYTHTCLATPLHIQPHTQKASANEKLILKGKYAPHSAEFSYNMFAKTSSIACIQSGTTYTHTHIQHTFHTCVLRTSSYIEHHASLNTRITYYLPRTHHAYTPQHHASLCTRTHTCNHTHVIYCIYGIMCNDIAPVPNYVYGCYHVTHVRTHIRTFRTTHALPYTNRHMYANWRTFCVECH